MRLLLVVNASASSVTARARVVIQKALAADHQVSMAETSRRGHAIRLAQGAAAEGVDVVVVLGGDGTLNEAANGLIGTTTALGVLPGGSTNVFARTIGMTNDPIEATGELLAALSESRIQAVNLGAVNGRYFLFHVGIGFDAVVVNQVDRRATLKRMFGHAVFVYAAVSTWTRHYDRSAPRLRVHSEPGGPGGAAPPDIEDGYFAICMNTNPYTFLGRRPLNAAPGTGLDTDLSLVTFRNLQLSTFLPLAASALGDGRRLGRHPWVDRRQGQTALVVSGAQPLPYQMDGEYMGESARLEIRSHRQALRLVVPLGPAEPGRAEA
ncbi:MAG: diacylglycerol/lipid kinase family protein [Acidimicrobiales bacterium]